jgi:putative membrane protein
MRLLIRWIVTAIALVVAVLVVPGITIQSNAWLAVAIMAIVLGLVNAIVRPLLQLLSCGLIVATLGFFLLFINGFTLMLASSISQNWFGAGFVVDGFWPAFWGAIVVSFVSFLLNLFVADDNA